MNVALDYSLPKFFASFTVSRQGKPAQVSTYEGPVPEALMDEYKKVVGNGLAKVTIAVDVSNKDFGSGASSMASVTLSCGQTEEEIRNAQELAKSLVMEFAYNNALTAKEVFDAVSAKTVGKGKPNY